MAGSEIRELMKKYNVRPVKSLGQNFLTEQKVIDKIVGCAQLSKDDIVLEIGPGLGSMTSLLAEQAGFVIGIEIDRHLIPALNDRFKDTGNIRILNKDILELDVKKDVIEGAARTEGFDGKVKVVANLPYYITTPIIMKLLEEDPGIETMVFMVQKEVAARMAADPGGKDYGALSVAVQYYSRPELVMTVPPHYFIPQPEVESAVVRMSVFNRPPVELLSRDAFFKTVKAAFGQRRKTLINALYNSGNFTAGKEQIAEIVQSIGLNENQRGETLTIMQFAALANSFVAGKLLKN